MSQTEFNQKKFLKCCQELFEEIDRNKDQLISVEDLKYFLSKNDIRFDELVINRFLYESNQKGSSLLNFKEFLNLINSNKTGTKKESEFIKPAFQFLQNPETQKIHLDELKQMMEDDFGIIINSRMFGEDFDQNEINFTDFKTFLLN